MFCDHCGAELARNAAACLQCSRPAPGFRSLPPQAALDNLRSQWVAYSRIRLYAALLFSVQIVAWLHLVLSSLQSSSSSGRPSPQLFPFDVLFFLVFYVGILGIVWGIVGYVGTNALAQDTPSGRQLASLMAALALLDVPFGSVLSFFILRAIARVNAQPPAKTPPPSQ